MLRTIELIKVAIIFPKIKKDEILRKLYKFGWLHLDEIKEFKDIFSNDVNLEEDKKEIFKKSAKLLHIKNFLEKIKEELQVEIKSKEKILGIKEIENIYKQISKDYAKLIELKEILENLKKLRNILVKSRKYYDYSEDELKTLFDSINRCRIADIKSIIKVILKKGVPFNKKNLIEKINSKIFEILHKIDEIRKNICEKLSEIYYSVNYHLKEIENEINYLVVYNYMKSKGELICLECFVPKSKKNELEKLLKDDPVILLEKEVDYGPTLLLDHPMLKPFNIFLDIYEYPKYGSIDPRIIMLIFFPPFLGLCLGDVGYGLVLLAISVLFIYYGKKYENFFFENLGKVLILSSIWGIIWGLLFGSFFSGMIKIPSIVAKILKSSENEFFPLTRTGIFFILLLSIVFGIIQTTLGLILNIIENKRNKKEVLISVSLLLIEFFGILYFLVNNNLIFIPVILSMIYILKEKGIEGFVKILELFSGILSYTRLAALCIATYALDLGIHKICDLLPEYFSTFLLPVFLFIAFCIHALPSFIHSLRLHLVELFRLYYKGTHWVFHRWKPLY